MKWFKHDTDCDKSEGLAWLIEIEGFAGYGRWFRLLEIIASKMDKTDRCSVEYPAKKWGTLLGLKQKKLKTFLEHCENKLKTKVVYSENIIIIEIPNLLKKRDEYSCKSGQNRENVPPKIEEVRSKIKDTDKEEPKDSTPSKKRKASAPKLSESEWLETLKANPAYKGIDVDREYHKCSAWCVTANRTFTRRTFVNWINRIDKPLNGGDNGQQKQSIRRDFGAERDARRRAKILGIPCSESINETTGADPNRAFRGRDKDLEGRFIESTCVEVAED